MCGLMIRDQTSRELELTKHITVSILDAQGSLQAHTTQVAEEVVSAVETMRNADLNVATSREESERLLASLKFPGLNERYSTLRNATRYTYRWIFPSILDTSTTAEPDDGNTGTAAAWDNFEEWLQSEDQSYWVRGKPGAGKSTLMKFIVDHPQTRKCLGAWRDGAIILHYFFWNAGSVLQRSLRGLYCTLLYQFLQSSTDQNNFYSMLISHSKAYTEHSDWPTTLLRETLLRLLHEAAVPVCIFLDGLDEICQEDGARSTMILAHDLRKRSHIKICLSSRPDAIFTRCLENLQHLRLENLNKSDMTLYLDEELRSSWRFEVPELSTGDAESLKLESYLYSWPDVSGYLICRSEGVFLWLALAVREMKDGIDLGDHPPQLRRRLNSLPRELSALYWDMWNRRNTDSVKERTASARLLTLMVDFHSLFNDSVSVLRPSILHAALCMEPGLASKLTSGSATLTDLPSEPHFDQFNLDVAFKGAGLVEILPPAWDERMKFACVLRFPHRSAYDFLTDTDYGRSILAAQTEKLETRLCTIAQASMILWGLFSREILYPVAEFVTEYATLSNLVSVLNEIFLSCKCHLPLGDTRWTWRDDALGTLLGLFAVGSKLNLHNFWSSLNSTRQMFREQQVLVFSVALRTYIEATGYPVFKEFSLNLDTSPYFTKMGEGIPRFLDYGADPNAKCLARNIYHQPFQSYDSAFATFLRFSLQEMSRQHDSVCDGLQAFLRQKLDLEVPMHLRVELRERVANKIWYAIIQPGPFEDTRSDFVSHAFFIQLSLGTILELLLDFLDDPGLRVLAGSQSFPAKPRVSLSLRILTNVRQVNYTSPQTGHGLDSLIWKHVIPEKDLSDSLLRLLLPEIIRQRDLQDERLDDSSPPFEPNTRRILDLLFENFSEDSFKDCSLQTPHKLKQGVLDHLTWEGPGDETSVRAFLSSNHCDYVPIPTVYSSG